MQACTCLLVSKLLKAMPLARMNDSVAGMQCRPIKQRQRRKERRAVENDVAKLKNGGGLGGACLPKRKSCNGIRGLLS